MLANLTLRFAHGWKTDVVTLALNTKVSNVGTLKLVPTPDFRISPRWRKAQEKHGEAEVAGIGGWG